MPTLATADFEREVLQAEGPVLALFQATWCGYCRWFLPRFRDATSERVRLVEVDLSDDDDPLWDAYAIQVIPTLLLFYQGQVVDRADGEYLRGLEAGELQRLLAAGEAVGKG